MTNNPYEIAYKREKLARLEAESQLEVLTWEIFQKNNLLETANEHLKKNQQALVQHEKMASVGQLATGIAHEINNPLAFSLSNLQVLMEYADELQGIIGRLKAHADISDDLRLNLDDPELTHIITDIPALTRESLEGLESVKQIIGDLRGFARSNETGDGQYDVNESIRTTLNVLRNEIKYKCQLHTDLGEIPPITYHFSKLNQVIANLVINALQAMPEQAGLYIKSYATPEWVIIEVSDDGPGVSEAIQSDIFTPFFTTKPVGEGTGLGLSICHTIVVEELKGKLTLLYPGHGQGKGATFRISLPINPGPVAGSN